MMLVKRVSLALGVLTLSFLLLSGCNVQAKSTDSVYKLSYIKDLHLKREYTRTFSSKRDIKVSLAYQVNPDVTRSLYKSHSPQFISNVFRRSVSKMDLYLSGRGVSVRDCRGPNYNINVVIVGRNILRDHSRFEDFFVKKYGQRTMPNNHAIYGFYNSTPEIENESTILLTNVSSSMNERIFAHEIAHYLWDRLCLANYFDETSEEFAVSFEKYYIRSSK